jgi:hypothetical protein
MDESEFVSQIRLSWEFFKSNMSLGRAFITPRSLPYDEEFVRVALAPESSYSAIYIMGLNRSVYNFILQDYSYFQFQRDDDDAWRLAYFPNPWITGIIQAQEIVDRWERREQTGGLTHEETSDLIADLPYRAAVPPIRFEYARSQYREIAHPAAHFHVGQDPDNRWPCSLRLGPLAFTMMVGRLYYRDSWAVNSSFFSGGEDKGNCLDRRFMDIVQQVQVVHDFSPTEMRSLHIGRNMTAIARSADHEESHRRQRTSRSRRDRQR